jgi:NADH-quinone oxidoreductase subunit H
MNPQSFEAIRPYLLPVLYGVVLVAVLPLIVGYIILLERKVMADMQARLGPMRVGPHGLLQPLADGVKLMIKEDIIPEAADFWVFWLAPLITFLGGMTALAAMAFGPVFQIADLNIGVLFILGVSSMGIYGIVLGGWASNSHYSLLGAMRSAAQLVSYETAAGMALVTALLLGGSLSMRNLVEAQQRSGVWFIFLAPIAFFIYLIASIAETNRSPFDLPEAESELVAGYMTEYSGFRWVIFMMAEYANVIVVSGLATTLFLGGWLRPFASFHAHLPGSAIDILDAVPGLILLLVAGYCFWRTPKQPVQIQKAVMALFGFICLGLAGALTLPLSSAFAAWMPGIHGAFWFLAKIFVYVYGFLWFRFTFPRYRFDQLMRLGWHFLIPLSLVNVMGVGIALVLHQQAGWGLAGALTLTTFGTLVIAGWLVAVSERHERELLTPASLAGGD